MASKHSGDNQRMSLVMSRGSSGGAAFTGIAQYRGQDFHSTGNNKILLETLSSAVQILSSDVICVMLSVYIFSFLLD